LELNLTQNEYYTIRHGRCYLCGMLDSNGIDRIYSYDANGDKIDYSANVCLPCCKTCNFIKYTYSIDQFIVQVHKICKKYKHVIHEYDNYSELIKHTEKYIQTELKYINDQVQKI